MDLSLFGVIGAAAGTAIGLVNYVLVMAVVTGSLRRLDRSQTEVERATFERKLAILRWSVLVIDSVVFAGIGYWLGEMVGGWLASPAVR